MELNDLPLLESYVHMKFKQALLYFLFLIATQAGLAAQELYAINAIWSDSFSQWSFVTADEEEGSFGLRWASRDDWSEWVFDFDGQSGVLKLKWTDNPNIWELRSGGMVVNIKTKWRGDFTEWRITDGEHKFTFESRYTNSIGEWRLKEKKHGSFIMKTEWENDPRDWNIYDELDESVEIETKMAMTFIAIISSISRI